MADEISELRLLVQLVAAGSVTRAAERLNSSPPAISRRLAALEARLGIRLIARNARRFALTEEGELLHERAVAILSDLEDAESEATARGKEATGKLRVGAPLQIGREQLGPLIARFSETHPKVQIELVLTDANVDVVEDELDIMLRLQMPDSPNLVVKRLRHGRRVACASPEYLKVHGAPSVPNDLRQHNCLILLRGKKRFDRWLFEEDGKRKEITVHGRLASTSSDVIHAWMLAGAGIGVKVLWDIERDLRDGRLIECLAEYACDQTDLYAVYATRQFLPPRMRAFLDFIGEYFSVESPGEAPISKATRRGTRKTP